MALKAVAVALVAVLLAGAPAASLLLPSQEGTGSAATAPVLPAFPLEAPDFFQEPGAVLEALPGEATSPLADVRAGLIPGMTYTPRPPIVIQKDSDFTLANGVVAGRGTYSDPYIISGWEIDGSRYTDSRFVGRACAPLFCLDYNLYNMPVGPSLLGVGILIQNTKAYVKVVGNHIHGMGLAGVLVNGAWNVQVEGNLIEVDNPKSNPSQGIILGVAFIQAENSRIVSNAIASSGSGFPYPIVGVYLDRAWNVQVVGNSLQNLAATSQLYLGIYDAFGGAISSIGNTVTNSATVGSFLGAFHFSSPQVSVRGNTLRNNVAGPLSQALFVRFSDWATVKDNDLLAGKAGGTAAWILQSKSTTLEGNRFHGSTYGLVVQQSPAAFLRTTTIEDNTYGFGLYGVTEADYAASLNHSTNTVNGKPFVYLSESAFNRWMTNTTVDASAWNAGWFGIHGATNVTLVNVSFSGNLQGALLVGLRSSRIVNATVTDNLRGIELAFSNNTTVSRFDGRYLMLVSSRHNLVENSTFTAPGLTGTYGARLVLGSHGNRFVHNLFEDLTYGVALNGSGTNNFTSNRFHRTGEASAHVEDAASGGSSFWRNDFMLRGIHHLRADATFVVATDNHWGHPKAPVQSTNPIMRADIMRLNGATVVATTWSATPFGAGPVP